MTSPTPPPGWHPDPGEPGLIRYWDGTQWTEHTQPGTEPTAEESAPTGAAEPGRPARAGVPRAVKIVGGIVAAFVVIGVLGAVFGDDEPFDDSQAAAQSTTSSAAAQETSTPAPSTTTPPATTTVPPTTTTTTTSAVAVVPPAPATYKSDPRCAPANQSLVDLVSSGFSESGLTLTNGTVIDAGDYTYIGGTTLDATGGVENRSDVWVVANGTVYSSTGGARNTTSWPRASSELDVSPGDPEVQAVDACVVDLTR
ncbi:DUF2510 domain-containing protein [Rhodococcus sp. IEGM 1354]|uniref:DUF2510 domain-containing protein n=1 Tax=Rhodococcus sp. IEGM 1354 TaxID=3047088 RepID=UPI0024B69204|nr:DUF2510 domain-containing protein [Rhodococcus sp. IEGM 1354]MDI9933406.1 DUF2510 domain-containing protein [Rhodococcus sp. IEGM 1354]